MINAQLTGILWFIKDDLTQEQLDKIKCSYTYVNPKDKDNLFSTYIEIKDKVGVPYGNPSKINNIIDTEIIVQDKRIQPKFSKKKTSKLQLRDYQETVMEEIKEFIYKGAGTSFNLSGEPGSQESRSYSQTY